MTTDQPVQPLAAAELAGRLRVAIHRLAHQLRGQSLHSGLTPSRLAALVLLETNGQMRVSDLAAAIGSALSSASRMADLLIDAGWVQRHTDPNDQRASLLELSTGGQSLLASLRRDITTSLAIDISELNPEQLRALHSAPPILEVLADRSAQHRPVQRDADGWRSGSLAELSVDPSTPTPAGK